MVLCGSCALCALLVNPPRRRLITSLLGKCAADPDAPPPRLRLGFLREMGLFTLAAAIVTVAVPLPWPVLRPAIVAVMALRAVRKLRAAAWPRREQWARLRRHDQKESRVTRQ